MHLLLCMPREALMSRIRPSLLIASASLCFASCFLNPGPDLPKGSSLGNDDAGGRTGEGAASGTGGTGPAGATGGTSGGASGSGGASAGGPPADAGTDGPDDPSGESGAGGAPDTNDAGPLADAG
jgi:hypothetical protein